MRAMPVVLVVVAMIMVVVVKIAVVGLVMAMVKVVTVGTRRLGAVLGGSEDADSGTMLVVGTVLVLTGMVGEGW